MASVDSFINGDNLGQAINCTENILVRSASKTLTKTFVYDQGAKTERSKNEQLKPNESTTNQIKIKKTIFTQKMKVRNY